MKKILIILGIVVIFAGLAGAGYWYWYNQVPAMQKVALDNANVKSFDDVCTEGDNNTLNCTGSIEQFGCKWYRSPSFTLSNLVPALPIIMCEKRVVLKDNQNVYIQDSGLGSFSPVAVDFIIIKDGYFQLIKSADDFKQVFQPIESIAEATAYFQGLHKGVLILSDQTLNNLKKSATEHYLVSPETFKLSSVSKTVEGFIITAYSGATLECKTELYNYSFLLKRNGELTVQNKILLWKNKQGYCFN